MNFGKRLWTHFPSKFVGSGTRSLEEISALFANVKQLVKAFSFKLHRGLWILGNPLEIIMASGSTTCYTANPFPSESSYTLVEGEFGEHLNIRRILPADHAKVIKHIQSHFMHSELSCQLLGYADDFGDEVGMLVKQMLNDGISFLAEHKESKELVAVRISFRATPHSTFELLPISSYGGKVLQRLGAILRKMSNLFEAYGVQEIGGLFLSSCSPAWEGTKIVGEMLKRTLALMKAEGYKLAGSVFTCHASRKLAAGLGFIEVCRLDYKEFIDEIGQLVFMIGELNDEHFAAVMVKLL